MYTWLKDKEISKGQKKPLMWLSSDSDWIRTNDLPDL
jgi:hypothetical protein